MRTTLTLDADVAERLRRDISGGRVSLKQAVNDRLRIGYGIRRAKPHARFRVAPHASAYRSGVDRMKLHQLLDEMDAEAFLSHPGRARPS